MLNASNDARTRLASDVSDSDTTVTVDSASSFPSAPFLITVNRNRENMEIMRVTEVDGENLTVERAQEGTTASGHSQGSIVENNFTAGTYHGLLDELENKESEIERLEEELVAHETEITSKVVRVREPVNQTVDTTIDLGFKPKFVLVDAVVTGTVIGSSGYFDESGAGYSKGTHSTGRSYSNSTQAVQFIEGATDRVRGKMILLNDGLRIEWTIGGDGVTIGEERSIIISAFNHGR